MPVVAVVVGLTLTAAAAAVAYRRQGLPEDPRGADEGRRDATLRVDDARIETDRTRGRQWPM